MEFLRFGSSIPGQYWGCCAADIIQNFKVDPDEKASIELVDGDGGNPVMFFNDKEGRTGAKFAGKTYADIFRQRLRYGTFNSSDKANHAFFAILTDWQINGGPNSIGYKWLKILKEEGFEFVRAIDNSVYTGSSFEGTRSSKPNYLFALYRNISSGRITDPFTPPKAWQDLPSVVPEAWEQIDDPEALATSQSEAHKKLFDALPQDVFYTREQLEKEGIPVTLAGRRSDQPQQLASEREKNKAPAAPSTPAPFAASTAKKVAPAA